MDKIFKNVNFIKNSNKYMIVSLTIIAIGIIFLFINGFNLDIDFTGGTAIEANLGVDFTEQEIIDLVKEVTSKMPTVQKSGEDGKGVIINFTEIEEDTVISLKAKIKEKYEHSSDASTRTILATYGTELKKSVFIAITVAVIAMIIYISIRFSKLGGLSSAITAIVGLVHNVLIMISVYIIFRIPINSAFIAAILTIIGYSINDTIILYDRIRENREDRAANKKQTLEELVNNTIKQVLKRTVNTTVTSAVTVAILLGFSIYFSQKTLVEFTFPLLIGLISGTYASICIATPLWYRWQTKNKKG